MSIADVSEQAGRLICSAPGCPQGRCQLRKNCGPIPAGHEAESGNALAWTGGATGRAGGGAAVAGGATARDGAGAATPAESASAAEGASNAAAIAAAPTRVEAVWRAMQVELPVVLAPAAFTGPVGASVFSLFGVLNDTAP